MPHQPKVIKMPVTREAISLLAVDRCVSELRRGRTVAIRGSEGSAALVQAAEGVTESSLQQLRSKAMNEPVLAITARRAKVLGMIDADASAVIIKDANGLLIQNIIDLANPLSDLKSKKENLDILQVKSAKQYSCESAGIGLAKISRLLPAALIAHIKDKDADVLDTWAIRHDLLVVDAGDIFQYEHTQARTLKAVSEAQVPLLDANNTRIISFRPFDGGLEHLAIVIGENNLKKNQPVLTRLHSECFTGDLLASLKCDCGDQLRGAINEISTAGGGVLLYLAQEGRGIGLVNKLRAYELQDSGFDTIEANEQLGFDADERIYLPAAEILRQLGFKKIRLMTNNPDKINSLAACGIDVVERVKHHFRSNKHNEQYLKSKIVRSGHLI